MKFMHRNIILQRSSPLIAVALALMVVGCAGGTGDSGGSGEAQLSPACEAVSQDLSTGLVEIAEKYATCASDADCAPISFNLTCPNDDTSLGGCPVAYALDQEDAFKAAAMQFVFSLCSSLEEVCVSSPNCPAPNTLCVGGACTMEL